MAFLQRYRIFYYCYSDILENDGCSYGVKVIIDIVDDKDKMTYILTENPMLYAYNIIGEYRYIYHFDYEMKMLVTLKERIYTSIHTSDKIYHVKVVITPLHMPKAYGVILETSDPMLAMQTAGFYSTLGAKMLCIDSGSMSSYPPINPLSDFDCKLFMRSMLPVDESDESLSFELSTGIPTSSSTNDLFDESEMEECTESDNSLAELIKQQLFVSKPIFE